MSPERYKLDQLLRQNKWGFTIHKRGSDYDTASIEKKHGFSDAERLAGGMWPGDARRICQEHNEKIAEVVAAVWDSLPE
jgi:hypothetical protein